MPRLKAIVAGAGSISRAWFPPLLDENIDVSAVVDLVPESARERVAEYGLKAESGSDLAAALERHRPDFVVDLTVPEAHCAVTCAALKAGCHVIGEKPMAASMNEARRMVSAADRAGRLYMVSQSRRYSARHASLRRVLAQGGLGQVTTLNCDFFMGCHFGGFRESMQSPLILDMAIHHFDLARMFSGADPVAVYAHEFNPAGSWYAGNVSAACVFEMSGGLVFNYRGSWCAEGLPTSWHGNWRIIGTRGTILYEGDQPPFGETVSGKTGFMHKTRPLTIREPVMRHEGQHGALREFLSAIRGGPQPQGECHDNIKSLSMVFAAIESAVKQTRVSIRA